MVVQDGALLVGLPSPLGHDAQCQSKEHHSCKAQGLVGETRR